MTRPSRASAADCKEQRFRAFLGVAAVKRDRRLMSTEGLVHGEALAPSLHVILDTADRPLTTHEVAVAMLKTRGLQIQEPKLTAMFNRVSVLPDQDWVRSKARAFKLEGNKERLPNRRARYPAIPAGRRERWCLDDISNRRSAPLCSTPGRPPAST